MFLETYRWHLKVPRDCPQSAPPNNPLIVERNLILSASFFTCTYFALIHILSQRSSALTENNRISEAAKRLSNFFHHATHLTLRWMPNWVTLVVDSCEKIFIIFSLPLYLSYINFPRFAQHRLNLITMSRVNCQLINSRAMIIKIYWHIAER